MTIGPTLSITSSSHNPCFCLMLSSGETVQDHNPLLGWDLTARPPRSAGYSASSPHRPLTQVVGDIAQVRLHHGGVQRQVMPQQLQVPGVVLEVGLKGEVAHGQACTLGPGAPQLAREPPEVSALMGDQGPSLRSGGRSHSELAKMLKLRSRAPGSCVLHPSKEQIGPEQQERGEGACPAHGRPGFEPQNLT